MDIRRNSSIPGKATAKHPVLPTASKSEKTTTSKRLTPPKPKGPAATKDATTDPDAMFKSGFLADVYN